LAFITALQLLPARQRAVLILRDVLGYHADEVAMLLGSSVESVTSALKRARATLNREHRAQDPAPVADSPAEQALVAAFVRAYQGGDIAALVDLMTDDVRVAMPPMPFEYEGRDLAARFFTALATGGRLYHLVPTRANGQLAFGAYLQAPTGGIRHGAGLLVLTLAGDRIAALTRFEPGMLPAFGLPRSLPR
jgi:RNA polymerase sigma-70 factor (ECF subfamily)